MQNNIDLSITTIATAWKEFLNFHLAKPKAE